MQVLYKDLHKVLAAFFEGQQGVVFLVLAAF